MNFTLIFLLLFIVNSAVAEDLIADLAFVSVPGGMFMMGSKGKYKDEQPIHKLTVNSFLLMDHELTLGELKKLLKTHPQLLLRNVEADMREYQEDLESKIDLDDMPVDLTWAEATTIAEKLTHTSGKRIRLLTEAEWEYAARGGLVGKQYPWGDLNDKVDGTTVASLLRQIWGSETCEPRSSMPLRKVRTLSPKNAFGLYDMAGNAWEWTSSLYRPYPYKGTDGREGKGRQDDMRVIRGGGAAPETCDVRVSFRGYGSMESRYGVRYVAEK
ncbi:MAG: SUMF1/EgtB/PvdO family nonheme iron enzyme [Candidatus Competibacter sp.]|nr:SUMF1/EgtB/PvdO family nonheme iron enzyme [Candidatus Competibacter sp.]